MGGQRRRRPRPPGGAGLDVGGQHRRGDRGHRAVARPGPVRPDAVNGALLPGWPFFTADSSFTTPALADLYGNGQTEIVEGGDSTAGVANGVTYTNGGHLRVIGGGGNLICDHDVNQTVDSSPAVGNFLAGGGMGIAFGTGSFYPGASDSNSIFGADANCNIAWETNLGGNTIDSPAIGDTVGDGSEQVIEGADTGSGGSVWVLNGANGQPLPGWPQTTAGRIIGGITTADLTGGGYNDVLVPTTSGLVIYDGRTAAVVATLGAGTIGLQNSPLVTIDPNGMIGITIAGPGAANEGIIQHYQVAGSAGHSLGKRSWPMFHHDPQLTGFLSQGAPGHLTQPMVGMAATPDGRGTGTWPRTAASSPSATPPSSDPPGASISTNPSSGWRLPVTARATGWSPPTAASSPSVTPPSTDPPAAWPSTDRRWAWPRLPTAVATGWSPPTAASSPSVTPPSTGPPAV